MNSYLESVSKQMVYYKGLADQAIAPLNDQEMNWQFNQESNSIAIIMKHMAGNMKSRFTDFLISDGEKPWRDRESEFEIAFDEKTSIVSTWESGWKVFFDALETIQEKDLSSIVYIRNEGHTVIEALNRQVAHYPYHIGQIVYISRMIQGTSWRSLSIPKGASTAFNKARFDQGPGRKHFTDSLKTKPLKK